MQNWIVFEHSESGVCLAEFETVAPLPEYREKVEIGNSCYIVVGFRYNVHRDEFGGYYRRTAICKPT